jgi:hypothetical protein
MKRSLAHAATLTLGCVLPAWAGTSQPLPTPFPELRYQSMSARSPFAISTASSAVAAPTPDFAAQLYIDGVGHVGNADFVAIKSRDPTNHKVLFLQVGKSSADGLTVERVIWSDQTGKSTVDVSKAGEKATLIFDQAQMASNETASQPVLPQPMLAGRQQVLPGLFHRNGRPIPQIYQAPPDP